MSSDEYQNNIEGMEMPEMMNMTLHSNELYNCYIQAEFTPRQALYLCAVLMCQSPGVAPPE